MADQQLDPVAAAKSQARARARAARCALDDASCRDASLALATQLLALPELALAHTVLAYGASAEELDPEPAAIALRDRGAAVAYPRVEAPGVLGLHIVDDAGELVSGMFGIREPAAHATRVGRWRIDAVLVPGVAFDERCWRLGYGGGYYDRLLPTLKPSCIRIGIAYDEQVLDTIPAEEHDAQLDLVVTPTRVLRAR